MNISQNRKNDQDRNTFLWDELDKQLHAALRMNRFRRKYFSSLIGFGREFDMCGRKKAAELLHEKIQKELQVQSFSEKESENRKEFNFQKVSEKIEQDELEELKAFYENQKGIFPENEKTILERELKQLQEGMSLSGASGPDIQPTASPSDLSAGEVGSRVRKSRDRIYDRAVRYKKAAHRKKEIKFYGDLRPSEGTGIYNSLFNLNSMMGIIYESDPFWVEDLKAHYRELQRLKALFKE
ncbi:hypothetical protein ACFL5V_04460 [Fibrobacterota bacterium]